MPMPFWLAYAKAAFLQLLPSPLLTVDQVRLLESDNVVSVDAKTTRRTLEALGVDPVPVEAIVPDYLERFRARGEFAAFRRENG